MNVEIGAQLPAFTRMGDFHAWNRFAAVNHEFVDIHMDDEAGRTAGHGGAVGMGNLQWAWLHCLLREWIGDTGGRIVSIACQFRSPSLRNQAVTAKGVVTGTRREDGELLVELDIWTEADDGTKLAPGKATVALPG
jgi:hypothetical protein